MFHALLFALKIGLLAAAAIWVSQRPGTIEIDWLGYHITAHVGLVLLVGLAVLLFVLVLHRFLLAIAGLPKAWKKGRARSRHDKGLQTLTRGLTAVAAGDSKQATDHADKVKKLWPDDKGLSLLLEAQAARLRGEEDVARSAFQKLLENKDTAFLGLRGLLVNALERGDTKMALELAQQAQAMHPRQPWIITMLYDLEVQERHWLDAAKTLKRAQRFKAIDDKRAQADSVVMLLAQAEEEREKGRRAEALKLLKAAHRLDAAFVPAALWLAEAYLARGKTNAAKAVIEKTWKTAPHPELAGLWTRCMPAGKKGKDMASARLAWQEKLAALNPESAQSYLTAAQIALDEQLWGEARRHLEKAEAIEPSAQLYRLFAELEECAGNMEQANEWLEMAAGAPAGKVWVCKEAGQIYDRWSPTAQPHGTFNTIIWDYPKPRGILNARERLPQNELLLVAK